MNRLLASALALGLAILAIFVYRGRASKDSDIVSGSIQNSQNLFTPDDEEGEATPAAADLPTVTPKSRVNTGFLPKELPKTVKVRPVENVIVTKSKSEIQIEKTAEVKRKLQESAGAESVRRSWKSGRVVAATKPKSDKNGGFFMDDDELPPAVA